VPQTSNPDWKITTRRMSFEETLAEIPKHFADDGDLLMSHFWAVLSATFPEGEDGFVRSVRHYRDQISDPDLKRQVAGFIGQEAQHSRAHSAFNNRLAELGYPVERIERINKRVNGFAERVQSPETNLAFTVASEHFTALMAELAFRDQRFRDSFGHPATYELLLWHALEEAEHKSVAFDVYRAIGGSEHKRIRTMRFMRRTLPVWGVLLLVQAIVCDPAGRQPRTLVRSIRRFKKSPLFSREMRDAIRDFERPDFHPSQRDTTALLEEWRERLFGEDGSMNDRLVGRAAVA
jgi:predicted metal-dependent hydrolase